MTDFIPQKADFHGSIDRPPSDWKDANSWTFEAFALHIHETHCSHCGAVTHHSEAFRMFIRNNPASVDRRYVPATYIPETLRVITFKLPVKHSPICHFCISDTRQGTERILVSDETSWRTAIREAQARNADKARRTPAAPAPVKDIRDLL